MLALARTELICDLAETYGLLDWRAVQVFTLAALASGLGYDSRVQRKIKGEKIKHSDLINAMIHDRLAQILWSITGQKGQAPQIAKMLYYGEDKEEKESFDVFESKEAFWDAINGGA